VAKFEPKEIENWEHMQENLNAKKAALYGYDLTNTQWRRLAVDENGELQVDAAIAFLNQAAGSALVSLGTTAQKIAFSGGDITIPTGTKAISIQNDHGSNQVYLGKSTIDSTGANAGYCLRNQTDNICINNIGSDFSIYIVASGASTTVRILYL